MDAPEERHSRRLAALLLVAASVLPFSNGLTSDFSYDDKAIVRDNVRIQSPSTLGQVFETSYFGGARGSGTAYRPILLLSYGVQWWIHGRSAALFRAVNVLLHAAVVLLLWSWWRRLDVSPPAALAASLLFAVLPIHVEAVTSLVGRGETLAAALTLVYLHLALGIGEGRTRRPRTALAVAVLVYLGALLTKESASVAPALAFLGFFRLADGGVRVRLRTALRAGRFLYAGSALALAGAFALRGWVLGGLLRSGRTGIFEVENPLAALPAAARVGNACLMLLRYAGRVVLPLRLSADESAWSIRPMAPLSPLCLGAMLLVAAASLLALARPRSAAAFGVLFFLVAFLPASNVPFPIGTIFAERVAYLPSAGLCLVLGAALAGSARSVRAIGPARTAALAAATLALGARVAMRNTVWASDESLFENSVAVAPASAKNHYNLGYIRAEQRQFRAGLEEYRRATEIYPKYWDAWAGRGKSERELGMLGAARRSYERSLEALPSYENGFFGLGLVLEDQRQDPEALATYRRGLAKNPASLPLAYRAALVASRLRDPSAEAAWTLLLAAHPGSLASRFGYAQWLDATGRRAASRAELRRILSVAPRDAQALRTLSDQSASDGRWLAAGLAREKAFRATRSADDLAFLEDAARRDPAYGRRFASLRPRWDVGRLLSGRGPAPR